MQLSDLVKVSQRAYTLVGEAKVIRQKLQIGRSTVRHWKGSPVTGAVYFREQVLQL